MLRGCLLAALAGLVLLVGAGCQRSGPKVAEAEPPVLPVSKPIQRKITNYVDFTGRTSAVAAVDVRPRVTGYLQETKEHFKEGAEVKKGQLLFEIDPRPYQAQLNQAENQVALYEAQLRLAQANYARDRPLVRTGAVTARDLDQEKAAVDEAAARIKSAKAMLEVYKLNLDFTKVTAPIDGMISRAYFSAGNLVNQDQTLLTTVVSLDPMNVYFDMDEPTLLLFRKGEASGEINSYEREQLPVKMALQGEDGYQHEGTLNFVNNQVNPATGSIACRGVFANPRPKKGPRLLSPGMFVRVRLPMGEPHDALLVVDRAVGSDQGTKFVYVVNKVETKDEIQYLIEYRKVKTGALQEDGLREILPPLLDKDGKPRKDKEGKIIEGLLPDEQVLVGGLQQVRPKAKIQPEFRPMPVLEPSSPPVTREAPRNAPSVPKDAGLKGGQPAPAPGAGKNQAPKR
jgi:multidrug efflux system membrane fusion protein